MEVISVEGLLALISVPSLITSMVVWLSQRKITKRSEIAEAERADRADFELMLMRSVRASISLGEATAEAVQRIPDANCNGDMHKALEYAKKIKHEQDDFIAKKGVENIV